jgi:hypothetical protein
VYFKPSREYFSLRRVSSFSFMSSFIDAIV